ncbi:MAG: disulfide bond formation protein B [Gammaproteobacteria bacterium]|jgi:disulfide bond formation protein DsbB|nr:disulfide bond formation protein B [Gammaproteobacteria bacterium]
MNLIFQARTWFFLVALACACLLAYGLYIQHTDFVDPCPLCVFQRLAFIWIGSVSLLAGIHNPGATGIRVYGSIALLGAITGASVAGRHLWLQNLPPDQVPECGMGLNYMLETMPFTQVLSEVLYGSGECAEVAWTFLGLSMPGWTFVWYSAFTVGTIVVLIKANNAKA